MQIDFVIPADGARATLRRDGISRRELLDALEVLLEQFEKDEAAADAYITEILGLDLGDAKQATEYSDFGFGFENMGAAILDMIEFGELSRSQWLSALEKGLATPAQRTTLVEHLRALVRRIQQALT